MVRTQRNRPITAGGKVDMASKNTQTGGMALISNVLVIATTTMLAMILTEMTAETIINKVAR